MAPFGVLSLTNKRIENGLRGPYQDDCICLKEQQRGRQAVNLCSSGRREVGRMDAGPLELRKQGAQS